MFPVYDLAVGPDFKVSRIVNKQHFNYEHQTAIVGVDTTMSSSFFLLALNGRVLVVKGPSFMMADDHLPQCRHIFTDYQCCSSSCFERSLNPFQTKRETPDINILILTF